MPYMIARCGRGHVIHIHIHKKTGEIKKVTGAKCTDCIKTIIAGKKKWR